MLVHDYLWQAADAAPDKVALSCGGSSPTYRELRDAAHGLSSALRARGLAIGDRVVIYLPNSVEAVVSIFGVAAAGGCFVVADPTTPPERLRYLVEHSGAIAVITLAEREVTVRQATDGLIALRHLLLVGADGDQDPAASFEAACRADAPLDLPVVGASDRVAIIYTSGSTGQPKGVTLSHGNIDAVAEAVSRYLRHTSDDVVLSVLQLAFGYGLLQLLVTVRTGGRLVLQRGFQLPYDVVNAIVTERVTGFAGVPTMFVMLLRLGSISAANLSSVRYLTNAGAALPPAYVRRLRQVFPNADVYLMHGQTECMRTSYLPPSEVDRIPTSIGKGMPNVEVWLVDEHGNQPAPGELGEMLVRGPNVMLGYWNDPEATARVVTTGAEPGDRVLHTGDLFRRDDDGWLYFVSRSDDIIKSRGEKVSPLEIENLLFAHDKVLEARVSGVPDDVLGEAIRAEIVPADGVTVAAQEIKRYLRRHLEDYKVPQLVTFVESLPKSPNGKITRIGPASP